MFGASRFGEQAASASGSFGFCARPSGDSLQRRHDMPRKCFNQRRILERARLRAAPCGSRACSGALFRLVRALRTRTAFGLPQRA
jgi:hypothetical protein